MSKIGQQMEQCRLCYTKGNDQINLQRETEFSQYVVETIGQHIKEVSMHLDIVLCVRVCNTKQHRSQLIHSNNNEFKFLFQLIARK